MSSNVTTDQVAIYDEMLRDWLQTSPIQTAGHPLLVSIATPDRAFSTAWQLLNGIREEPPRGALAKLPLPLASLSLSSVTFDNNRFRGANTNIETLGTTENDVLWSKYPMPYTLTYQIDFWAKYRVTINKFVQWINREFISHELYRLVDLSTLSFLWGTKYIPIQNGNGSYPADIEFDESTPRTIRYTHNVTVLGWLFNDIQSSPAIKQVQIEYSDVDGTQYDTSTIS